MSADNTAAPVADAPAAVAPVPPAPVFYKVSTPDGAVFRVQKECLMLSRTLYDCAMNLGYTDDNIEQKDPIPTTKVSAEIFKMVHSYMKHHKGEEYVEPARGGVVIDAWDAEFLKAVGDKLFDLITAADYLDIKGLSAIASQAAANMIRGKTPQEMREIWRLPAE